MGIRGRVLSQFAAILVVFSPLALACNAGSAEDSAVVVTTDKVIYSPGESVAINVSLVEPIFASFSSSCQSYFVVEDQSGEHIYDLRLHVGYCQVLTCLVGPKSFLFAWNQKDDTGHWVSDGTYNVSGFIAGYHPMDDPIAGDYTSITIGEQPSSVAVASYAVNFVQGWNSFSLPLLAPNYTSDSLGLPSGSIVVSWDSVNQHWGKTFIVGSSPPSFAFPIAYGVGYFAYVAAACSVTIYGQPGTPHYEWIVPSWGGWVLAGFPQGPIRVSDFVGTIPGISLVVSYDASTGMYITYVAGMPINDFALLPGIGYWIYIPRSITWP